MRIIFLFAFLISLISCEEKLPSNIKESVNQLNSMIDIVNKYDSVILSMDVNSINKLDKDSLFTLSLYYSNAFSTYYLPYKNKLDEVLKLNPKYSDNSEVKSIKKLIRDSNKEKYENNMFYIENLYKYRKYGGKKPPVYGNNSLNFEIN